MHARSGAFVTGSRSPSSISVSASLHCAEEACRSWLTQASCVGVFYRVFYAKEGTLYFWGESCLRELSDPFPPLSLFYFVDGLIPISNGTNDAMTLAKLSARIKLWLSKTESRGMVDQVRWVPDLTNHTLAIGSGLLAQVCVALGLDYAPSECRALRNLHSG